MGRLVLVDTLSKHKSRVWNVGWHPNGKILTSCSEDHAVTNWMEDSSKSKWVAKKEVTKFHTRTVRQAAWSPNDLLALACFDSHVYIWDKDLQNFDVLSGHESEVKSVAWSSSGDYLGTCSRDKSVCIWDMKEKDNYELNQAFFNHTQDVKKVVWSPVSDKMASASYDNNINIYGIDPRNNEFQVVTTLTGHESTVWSLCWDGQGEHLASCSDDKTIKIWKEYQSGDNDETTIMKCVATIKDYHKRCIYDISWNHTTGLIATACGDNNIRIFKEDEGCDRNAPTYSQVECIENAHSADINCVQWNPKNPELLASCSDDCDIKLWKITE